MRKSFFDFFPTPQFLNVPYCGISISDTHVRSIFFGHVHGKNFVKQYAEVSLPEGVISGGFVHKPEDVIKALVELRKKQKTPYVKATLPEEKAYLFTSTINTVPDANMHDSVEFILEENAPVKAVESVFDFAVLPQGGDAQKTPVVVSVVPQKVVNAYCSMLESAGFVLLSLETESQAIASAVIPNGDMRTYLIINCDTSTKTGFYIVSEGVVKFSSTETMEDAQLSGEIKRLQAYWQTTEMTNPKSKKIEKVIVCGAGATKQGLVERIGKEITVPVELGNVWVNAFSIDDYIPALSFEDSLSYAAAAGRALPQSE